MKLSQLLTKIFEKINKNQNALSQDIANEVSAREIAISGEAATRTSAIQAETDRATAAESTLTIIIEAEVSRATIAEAAIQASVATVQSNLDTVNATLTAKIDNKVDKETGKSLFSGNYSDLTCAPTLVSSFTNDMDYATVTYVNSHHDSSKQNVISESNKLDYSLISNTPTLATVAISGNYTDLLNTPTLGSLAAANSVTIGMLDNTLAATLTNKVNKEEGKGLSTNDYTTAEKTKLAGIAEGATKVEVSAVNGNITINDKDTVVYTEAANTVHDANYAHITVTDTTVSDGTNTLTKYDDTALAGRVTAIENNYLTSTDKTELEGKIDAAHKFQYKVVTEWPEEKAENVGTIFLYKPEGKNSYEEWIVIDNGESANPRYTREKLGDTDIKLADYYDKNATDSLLASKVNVVEGYTLSKNDFTDILKTKLNGIAEGAEVNTVSTIKVNNATVAPSNKIVNIAIPVITPNSAEIATATLTNIKIDSVNYSIPEPTNYIKSVTVATNTLTFINESGTTITYTPDLSSKQDKLSAGNNIKIEGSTISAIIPSSVSSFVNDAGYITKNVSDLENYTLSASLATVATSGNYGDLSNTPTIPDVYIKSATFASNTLIITNSNDTTVIYTPDLSSKQNVLTAGNNINITDDVISVTGMPTAYVSSATVQTIDSAKGIVFNLNSGTVVTYNPTADLITLYTSQAADMGVQEDVSKLPTKYFTYRESEEGNSIHYQYNSFANSIEFSKESRYTTWKNDMTASGNKVTYKFEPKSSAETYEGYTEYKYDSIVKTIVNSGVSATYTYDFPTQSGTLAVYDPKAGYYSGYSPITTDIAIGHMPAKTTITNNDSISYILQYILEGTPVYNVYLDNSIELTTGASYSLEAQVVPESAVHAEEIDWQSSDDTIVAVQADPDTGHKGIIWGMASGTATITATSVDGGHTATCLVTVKDS